MIDFSTVVKRLVDSGVAKPSEIVGCTEEEIRALEATTASKLPQYIVNFYPEWATLLDVSSWEQTSS